MGERDAIYFIMFTCKDWLPLFELTESYDAVYKWFDYLEDKGHLLQDMYYLDSAALSLPQHNALNEETRREL